MTKELVLVTGVTGFLGTHVALEFFKAGYRVRGTARSDQKAQEWIDQFPEHKQDFEHAIVKDIAEPGAFDEAVNDLSIVAHTASPYHFNAKDVKKDMLDPAIEGTLNICRATRLNPSIRHLVLTSSFAAIRDWGDNNNPSKSYTAEDWNPSTYEQALKQNSQAVYPSSKKLAEEAAWKYKREEKPSWELTTICPPMIYGPPYQVINSLDSLNTSTAQIWGFASGKVKEVGETRLPYFCDVRDVASAHVKATQLPQAKNQRYLLCGGRFSMEEMVGAIGASHPELQSHLAPTKNTPAPDGFKLDPSKAAKELDFQWIPFEKSIGDTVTRLLEIQKKLEAK